MKAAVKGASFRVFWLDNLDHGIRHHMLAWHPIDTVLLVIWIGETLNLLCNNAACEICQNPLPHVQWLWVGRHCSSTNTSSQLEVLPELVRSGLPTDWTHGDCFASRHLLQVLCCKEVSFVWMDASVWHLEPVQNSQCYTVIELR